MKGSVNYRLTLGAIRKPDGTLTKDVVETLEELVNHDFTDDDDSDETPEHTKIR